ncbi:hypothetical protein EDD93_2704 [Streptomyces sp. 840.1]|nr:hypothetical protein [Streptomyces sp. 840.1]ROQ68247.1 hypothetical protein EDD93_2704 [Streptomyces sp. 840.1]
MGGQHTVPVRLVPLLDQFDFGCERLLGRRSPSPRTEHAGHAVP